MRSLCSTISAFSVVIALSLSSGCRSDSGVEPEVSPAMGTAESPVVEPMYGGLPEQLRTALLATHESDLTDKLEGLRELSRLADPRSRERL